MLHSSHRQVQTFTLLIILLVVPLGLYSCKAEQFFKAQEWSENYALLDGTTCTSPLMIDGDTHTVGESNREIIITLPERQSIHRLVLRGINFEDFIVYQGRLGEGNWQKLESVSNNQTSDLELRVTATTDRIRFRIGNTFDDERAASRINTLTGQVTPQRKRAPKRAAEIELYGFKAVPVTETPDIGSNTDSSDEDIPLPDVDIEDEPLF